MQHWFRKNHSVIIGTTVILAVLFAVVFLFTNIASAQSADPYGVSYAEDVGLSTTDIRISVIRVIRTILGVLGILALILMITAGVIWMTSGGNSARIELAKKIILNALIGLLIIVMAFAIVQYIFKVLEGDGSGGPSGPICQAGQCYGCMKCNAQGTGYWCDENCGIDCYDICYGPGPNPNNLILNDVQTSHAGADDKTDVYWCSKVQAVFNKNISQSSVTDAVSSGDLRIAANASSAPGDWSVRGNIVTFAPENKEFLNHNTEHSDFLPSRIEDTSAPSARPLSVCSLSASCEDSTYPDFRWDFYVGDDGDLVKPYVTRSYPQSSDPANPDQNVDLSPVIDISFNEKIDATTILDVNGINPFPGHFYVNEYDPASDTIGTQVSNSIFSVEMKTSSNSTDSKGFLVRMQNPNKLKPFTYYIIRLSGIEDLCGNVMDDHRIVFATNNKKPGVSSYYPTGTNVCPDTHISSTYNTTMFFDQITFSIEVVGSGDLASYILSPSTGLFSTTNKIGSGIDGQFRVVDQDLGNISSNYKVFEFLPTNPLSENTSYQISYSTNRIINANGDTLNHNWQFGVTDLGSCVCEPYISYIKGSSASSNEGPVGDCITIHGKCFRGTSSNPAEIDYINFNNVGTTPGPGYTNYSVGTTVPGGFSAGDRPEVTLAIDYGSANSVDPSDPVEFFVTPGTANGPCLWSVSPDYGPRGASGLKLTGIRFGDNPTTKNITFTPNAVFSVTDPNSWSDTEITSVTVPLNTEDGDVFVTNDQGSSNGMPFDVRYCGDGIIDPGEQCDGVNLGGKDCTNYGFVGGTPSCDANCNFDDTSCSNAPKVVEISTCEKRCGGDPAGDICFNDSTCPSGINCAISTSPSPNPYKNDDDACINSSISATFNTEILTSTFNQSHIFIKECPDSSCSGLLGDVPAQISGPTNYSFSLEPNSNLLPDTWYQVTITTGIQSQAGINMVNDYIWKFKTKPGTSVCPLEGVLVKPDSAISGPSTTSPYKSVPVGPNCAELSGAAAYSWVWKIDSTPDLGVTVSNQNLSDTSEATVTTGTEKGRVLVRADAEGKYDRSPLTITFDTCATDAECQAVCPGSTCDTSLYRCKPVIDSLSPSSGPAGQIVTIQGCQFKSKGTNSQVTFGAIPVDIYPCGGKWTDIEIIVTAPSTLSIGGSQARVTDKYGLDSNTNNFNATADCNGSPVPATGLPELCSISKVAGMPGDSVNLSGRNFGNSQEQVTFNGLDAPISSWSDTSVSSSVPDSATDGDLKAVIQGCPSNGLYFDVSTGSAGDPCDGNTATPTCDASNTLCWPGYFCDPNPADPNQPDCSCQTVPNAAVIPASRFPAATGSTCRNIVVKATFDQKMKRSTISESTVELWQRTASITGRRGCVLQADFVVNDNPKKEGVLARLWNSIKNIFGGKKAYAQSVPYWCPIDGSVSSRNVATGVDSCANSEGCTTVLFTPDKPLDASNIFEFHIKAGPSGVKSALGGELTPSTPDRKKIGPSYYWNFNSGTEICIISHVQVDVELMASDGATTITRSNTQSDYFTCALGNCSDDVSSSTSGNQHSFKAAAYSKDNEPLIANYTWSETDPDNLIAIESTTAQDTFITPENKDGKSSVMVIAADPEPTVDPDYGSASRSVTITNFICQNPWPDIAHFPYAEPQTCSSGTCYDMNFATYYCRDYGNDQDFCKGGANDSKTCTDNADCLYPEGECLSSTTDDLPALTYPGNVKGEQSGYCVGGGPQYHGKICTGVNSCGTGYCYNVLKEFLFTYQDGTCALLNDVCPIDSIGIRLYNNTEHLSPGAWYQKYARGSGRPNVSKVDGYESISQGRSTYVNMAATSGSNIYTNIFLLSYTDNYDAMTLSIHDQLLENLQFNYNSLKNERACSTAVKYCEKDSDCPSGEICGNDKDKLARDVIRMGHLNEMVYHLDYYRGHCSAHDNLSCAINDHCPDYNASDPTNPSSEICVINSSSADFGYYPALTGGTYLAGQSVSVWDSWGDTFASLLGSSPLIDPLNEVVDCAADYSSDECWNQITSDFACNDGSHMYHYKSNLFCRDQSGNVINQSCYSGDKYNGQNCAQAGGTCRALGYEIFTKLEYSNSGWQHSNSGWSTNPTNPCQNGAYNISFTK